MKIIFEKGYKSNLEVYIKCDTAASLLKVENLMYTHSEFDTDWSKMLGHWHELNYCKDLAVEKLVGHSGVIIHLNFTGSDCSNEFIKSIDKYFDKDSKLFSTWYEITLNHDDEII